MAKWIKTSPYGDYKDPKQNHKDVDYSSQKNRLIKNRYVKFLFGKHIGSKKLTNILSVLKKANYNIAKMATVVKDNKTNKEESSSLNTDSKDTIPEIEEVK